jgi:hypothetical protein
MYINRTKQGNMLTRTQVQQIYQYCSSSLSTRNQQDNEDRVCSSLHCPSDYVFNPLILQGWYVYNLLCSYNNPIPVWFKKLSCGPYMDADVHTVCLIFPRCTPPLCKTRCSEFANEHGAVIKSFFCEKANHCQCSYVQQQHPPLTAKVMGLTAEDDNITFVWIYMIKIDVLDRFVTWSHTIPYTFLGLPCNLSMNVSILI